MFAGDDLVILHGDGAVTHRVPLARMPEPYCTDGGLIELASDADPATERNPVLLRLVAAPRQTLASTVARFRTLVDAGRLRPQEGHYDDSQRPVKRRDLRRAAALAAVGIKATPVAPRPRPALRLIRSARQA